MPTTIQTLSSEHLQHVTGGAGGGNAPLGGDVHQNINTNWGGTQIINQAPVVPPPPTTRTEYLRQNPAARFGPPPYKPRPIR
jgi:hypothetical protein